MYALCIKCARHLSVTHITITHIALVANICDLKRMDLYTIRTEELGLSQQELADALGVDQGTISRWENGQAIPGPAERFVNVLRSKVKTFTDKDTLLSYAERLAQ